MKKRSIIAGALITAFGVSAGGMAFADSMKPGDMVSENVVYAGTNGVTDNPVYTTKADAPASKLNGYNYDGASYDWIHAKQYCDSLKVDGMQFRLPDRDEAYTLIENKEKVGGFKNIALNADGEPVILDQNTIDATNNSLDSSSAPDDKRGVYEKDSSAGMYWLSESHRPVDRVETNDDGTKTTIYRALFARAINMFNQDIYGPGWLTDTGEQLAPKGPDNSVAAVRCVAGPQDTISQQLDQYLQQQKLRP